MINYILHSLPLFLRRKLGIALSAKEIQLQIKAEKAFALKTNDKQYSKAVKAEAKASAAQTRAVNKQHDLNTEVLALAKL